MDQLRTELIGVALVATLAASAACHRSGADEEFAPEPEAALGVSLSSSFESAAEAAREALALVEAGDRDGLHALALSEEEFRELVYPELPASRPERNTSADFVWGMLEQRSRNALGFTLDRHRGKSLELVGVDFLGETTDYGSFRVHRETALTVTEPGGEKSAVRIFGSMIEQDGRFKIFSFVTD